MILLTGDAESVLSELPKAIFQCVVTSPPYWGLRDYGTARWEDGSSDCNHRADGERRQLPHGDGRENDSYTEERVLIPGAGANFKRVCGKCGAIRIDQQIGLEEDPDKYCRSLVRVFQEVWRVLRNDGTLWLNLGDSYARSAAKGRHKPGDAGKQKYIIEQGGGRASAEFHFESESGGSSDGLVGRGDRAALRLGATDLKPKDLIGIPWRVAFALQSYGWYLRQDIIWAKTNPMPESVTDRATRSHEYLFLLTKSERYYYNADAIKEPLTRPEEANRKTPGKFGGANKHKEAFKQGRLHSGNAYTGTSGGKRNKRDVWFIGTQSYRGAHFATFPEALVEPYILAGSQPGDLILDPFIRPHGRIQNRGG